MAKEKIEIISFSAPSLAYISFCCQVSSSVGTPIKHNQNCTGKACPGRPAENDQVSRIIYILPGEMEHTVSSNQYHIPTHLVIWGPQLNYCAALRKICEHSVNDTEHAQGEEQI